MDLSDGTLYLVVVQGNSDINQALERSNEKMNAYEIDLKVTDALERRLVQQEFAELADAGTKPIDRIILRLLAVTSLLICALMLTSAFL